MEINFEKLINEALKYRERAYAPYSNFKVGAAVLFKSGNIYGGCNIENASYGAANCAERTAIFKGISEGETSIQALVVIGDLNSYTYPCGICRQVIAEFASKDTKIIVAKNVKDYVVRNFEEILPYAFDKEDLK